jgi:hypothetical protein
MSAMVPLITGQVVMLNPCTLAMPSAKPAPVAPPGHFSRCSGGLTRTEATEEVKDATKPLPTVRQALAGPPGSFVQARADFKVLEVPEETKDAIEHHDELKELEDQQKKASGAEGEAARNVGSKQRCVHAVHVFAPVSTRTVGSTSRHR